MNNSNIVGDRTEPCGIQWPSTTTAIDWSGRKLEMKEQRKG